MEIKIETKSLVDTKNVAPVIINNNIKGYSII
jgi:flagellar basal body P-ring protein FlgI